MYSDIIVTSDKASGIIALNRPERRNALSDVMIRELSSAVTYLCRQNEIRTIIITGMGDSFCSGMDIAYLQESMAKTHEENVEDAKNLQKLLLSIQNAKKPVIAMVNGPAMGGGCGLAAACDFVFAENEKAKFGVPEVRLGFVPAVILHFLIKKMGDGRSREFVLKGETADAHTAKSYGLASEVAPIGQLTATVLGFSQELASSTSPSSITLTKELFMRIEEMNHRDSMDFASNLNAMVRKTDDFRKGMEAFLKKEKPQW
jgi:methylglutaconyl-CoA hydratase